METPKDFRVVVLTRGDQGLAVANAIAGLAGVSAVLLVRAPSAIPHKAGSGWLGKVFSRRSAGRRFSSGSAPETSRDTRAAGAGAGAASSDPSGSDRVIQLRVEDFAAPATIRSIRDFQPILGVLVESDPVPAAVFSIPGMGSINLHNGKTPEYRGATPGFWEMYNGDPRVGITVHWVDEGINSGAVLRQENLSLPSAPEGDPLEYIRRFRERVLAPVGLRLVVAAVEDVIAGKGEGVPQDHSAATTWSPPTWLQRRELRSRVARRRSPWRRRVKRGLGWLLFRSGLYRIFTRKKAFIVLFHRVDDRYAGNPISCGTREFERYCAFFARYFDVISASRMVDLLEQGEDISGKLVITFDDGYKDNLAAAETMRRHGLTGCFFITTDYIGTDRDGPWDTEEGVHSRWMDWDDVRSLVAMGYEVGSHTVTHPDLGITHGEGASREIRESKAVLEQESGHPVTHFGYPFGGHVNMTARNRELVRAAGYRSCMSAYGGIVTSDANLYDLRRLPVSGWQRSVWQLGLELLLEGWRAEPQLPKAIPGDPTKKRAEIRAIS
ncbi:MAG: polysaccharide deacetylase family protein [Gemmatimonadota bacterium]|nr:polysaccharide deacetylase family protein [Gemmatimonadota bacterium]